MQRFPTRPYVTTPGLYNAVFFFWDWIRAGHCLTQNSAGEGIGMQDMFDVPLGSL